MKENNWNKSEKCGMHSDTPSIVAGIVAFDASDPQSSSLFCFSCSARDFHGDANGFLASLGVVNILSKPRES